MLVLFVQSLITLKSSHLVWYVATVAPVILRPLLHYYVNGVKFPLLVCL